MSLFPSSTEIVVGPGFKASPIILPGYPEKPDSPLNASDFAGRHLNEVDFGKAGLRIGGFGAYDFFGDGSFYLLGMCEIDFPTTRGDPRFADTSKTHPATVWATCVVLLGRQEVTIALSS